MSSTAPSAINGLLPRDLQDSYNTGEVLEFEFKAIHGSDAWDPVHRCEDQERNHLIAEAKDPDNRDRADAEPLALHAWSVRNLPEPGQAGLLSLWRWYPKRRLRPRDFTRTCSSGVAGPVSLFIQRFGWRLYWQLACRLAPPQRHRRSSGWSSPSQVWGIRGASTVAAAAVQPEFLTPKVGLVSADTWTVLGAVLRNLMLNWLVFLPLLFGLLLVPRIVQEFLVWMEQYDPNNQALNPHSSIVALFGTWAPHHAGETFYSIGQLGWRSLADTAAIFLILLGFGISAYNRPASGLSSMTQARFLRRVVSPVTAGATILAAAVASYIWARDMDGTSAELWRWVFFGSIVYFTAGLVAAFRHLRGMKDSRKALFPLELIAWAVAGACTGLLIGLGAQLCSRLALPYLVQPSDYLSLPTDKLRYDLAKYLTVYGPPWILFCFLVGEAIYVGVTSRMPSGERDREWLARAAGWFGIVAVAHLAFFWLVLFGWDWANQAGLTVKYLVTIGGAGLLSIFGALLPLTRSIAASASKEKLPMTVIVAILSGVFVLGASAALAQATLDLMRPTAELLHQVFPLVFTIISELPDRTFEPGTELSFIAITCLMMLLISAAVSFFVNVNLFSLHALYRNRLIKTFLGASNIEHEERDTFDGFSEKDNLTMAQLAGEMNVGEVKLYPVLNLSLNVLATQNLAWQERKAEPFVCTPLFTGGDRVGYRPSALYAAGWWGSINAPERGISLGTAMAISGAAVSPNWGYHSSPITSFLMMLANVRLGWWLGNPKNRATWRYRGPRLSWRLFLQEALGWTDDSQPWIYLSDGGHFENLGLYEMVRRRCRVIVVSDAGADPKCTLEDLGNAVRKIAIDLGVKIEFRRIHVRKRNDVAAAGVYCAEGEIRYPEGSDGRIIYFKPGFYGAEEPADVRAYAAANAKFPHESTLNQWFGESQFESYRSLGTHVIEEICKKIEGAVTLKDFLRLTRDHLDEFEQDHITDGATLVDIRRTIRVAPVARTKASSASGAGPC
jgi:hypothetical protein